MKNWPLPFGVVLLLAAFICAMNDVGTVPCIVLGIAGIAGLSYGLVESGK